MNSRKNRGQKIKEEQRTGARARKNRDGMEEQMTVDYGKADRAVKQ